MLEGFASSSARTSGVVAPFWGAVRRHGVVRPEGRVRHVARDLQRDVPESRVEVRQTRIVPQHSPQCCQEPNAAVGRSRPADAEDDRPGPFVEAAMNTCPVPNVWAATGSRSSGARRDKPDASASSITALSPSVDRSQRASVGRPMDPGRSLTATPSRRPPRSRRACPRRRRRAATAAARRAAGRAPTRRRAPARRRPGSTSP